MGKHEGATLSPSEGFLMCVKHASPLRGHPETCPSGLTLLCPSELPSPQCRNFTSVSKHIPSGPPPPKGPSGSPGLSGAPAVGRPRPARFTQPLCGLHLCLEMDTITPPIHSGVSTGTSQSCGGVLAPGALTRPLSRSTPCLGEHQGRLGRQDSPQRPGRGTQTSSLGSEGRTSPAWPPTG